MSAIFVSCFAGSFKFTDKLGSAAINKNKR